MKVRASAASSKRMSSDGDKLTAHFRKEKASNNLASAAMGMASRLGRLEEPERPTEDASLKFLFKGDNKKKATLLDVRDVEVKHGDSCVIDPLSLSIRNGECILLKEGENGSGKTSIINAIVSGDDKALGDVYLSHKAGMVYIDQNQSLPLPNKSALETAINGFGGGILFVSHDRDFVEHVRPTQVITLSSAD